MVYNLYFPANIIQYKIYQGNTYSNTISWVDTKYKEKIDHINQLSGNKGCLLDRQYSSSTDPLNDPECWLGWKKSNISDPFVEFETLGTATFTGLFIRTYVNENIGASTIKGFTIEYSSVIGAMDVLGYVCAPLTYYQISPQIKDFYIDLKNVKAQYLKVKFQYSGEWILVRQVIPQQGVFSLFITFQLLI